MRLTPVDEPPFFATRFAEQGSHTMDGLLINEDMQVLDEDLNVIPFDEARQCPALIGTSTCIAAGRRGLRRPPGHVGAGRTPFRCGSRALP